MRVVYYIFRCLFSALAKIVYQKQNPNHRNTTVPLTQNLKQ